MRELDEEGVDDEGVEEELLELELLPGLSEEAVSRTCSTTRLITLRPRALFAATAAPAAAPAAAAAIAVLRVTRRLRVDAPFFAAFERFFAGVLFLRGAAFLAAGRRFAPDFFFAAALRGDLRAEADFFFELFLLEGRFFELLFFDDFFDDFFEDFFEPFFDAIGSLLFKSRWGP